MKFGKFEEFKLPAKATVEAIGIYLSLQLKKTLRDLAVGLTRLKLLENFESFSVEVTIASGAELAIRNQFRDGTIPSQRIIVKGGTDSQNIVDGDTAWTATTLYLKNDGASTATATVIFLK